MNREKGYYWIWLPPDRAHVKGYPAHAMYWDGHSWWTTEHWDCTQYSDADLLDTKRVILEEKIPLPAIDKLREKV